MDEREECISAEAKFTAHSRGKESIFLFFSPLDTQLLTVYFFRHRIAMRPDSRQKRLTKRMKSMNESNKRTAINQFSLLQTEKKRKRKTSLPLVD